MLAELKHLLEFSLFKIRNYEISVFDLLLIAAVLLGARLLVWLAKGFLQRRLFSRGTVDEGRQYAFVQLVRYFVYVIAALIILQTMGVQISALLVGSAALLVGVGLGLQQTFNDLVSGLILLFEGNVSVGDIIEINNLVGRVVHIGIRTSKVETRDAILIIVPNSKFIVDNVINWSNNRKLTRFTISLHASYETDPQRVREVLLNCIRQHRDVVDKPLPFVRLQHFGEYGVEYHLMFWTANVWRIENLKSEVRYGIYRSFREHNIVIPYPRRDIFIHSNGPIPAHSGYFAAEPPETAEPPGDFEDQ